MPAKEAIQFNFLQPHALSEMIKGTLKYSFSVPRFSLLFIACYFSVLGSIMTILLSTQSLKNKLYMKKHWRSLSEEGKMNAENGQWERGEVIRLAGKRKKKEKNDPNKWWMHWNVVNSMIDQLLLKIWRNWHHLKWNYWCS